MTAYELRISDWSSDVCSSDRPDEIPAGAEGLTLQTRLNGQVVQNASTSDMIFGVAETISLLSTFMTLEAGDVLVMGTPAGIGLARKPPLFMKDGDVCEVEIEGLGIDRKSVVEGKCVSVRGDLGGRRIIKKKR